MPQNAPHSSWLRLSVTIPIDAVDLVSDALLVLGAAGIQEEYPELAQQGPAISGDPREPVPPPPEPDSGAVVLSGTLPPGSGASGLVHRLGVRIDELTPLFPGLAGTTIELEHVKEEDWQRRWMEHYRPLDVGHKLRIRPRWYDPQPGDRHEIVIEPGMAFGTGTHFTTAGCLESLEEAMVGRDHPSVLDVGTGTGVLAIAAAHLGAGPIHAVEPDPDAVAIARTNLTLNSLAGTIRLTTGTIADDHDRHDIILANVLAPVLVALARELADHLNPGGLLIASGLLLSQEAEVTAAFAGAGLQVCGRRADLEWVVLEARRAPLSV